MRKFTFVFITLIVFPTISMLGQQWLSDLPVEKRTSPSFYDMQQAFSDYAEEMPPNFKGSKQYKRWAWYMESRLDEDGYFPAATYWDEINKLSRSRTDEKGGVANWTTLGPTSFIPRDINSGFRLGVGRVDCIEFHPTDSNTFWIGAPCGGIWKTEDGGGSWNVLSHSLPNIGVSDIVIEPGNPDIIYMATGDRDAFCVNTFGVLKSTDGGLNWDTTGLNFNLSELRNVNKLLMNPLRSSTLFAATSIGIYRTDDAGENWIKVSLGANFKDLAYKPGDTSLIYATTFSFNGTAKIYRSLDGGQTFDPCSVNSQLSGAGRITLGVSPSDPEVVYALCSSVYTQALLGIWKSTDAGDNWTQVYSSATNDLLAYLFSLPGGQAWYDMAMSVSPLDADIVNVGGVHIWKSYDGANVFDFKFNGWIQSNNWIHCDYHEFSYNPLNNKLYACCDGGIYVSDDHGESYIDISAGLTIVQSYRIGVSELDDMVLTGNQDNASMRFKGDSCNGILHGDGMDCMVDYTNPQYAYGSVNGGVLYRSADTGKIYVDISPPGLAGTGAWSTPFIMHPANPFILYCGYTTVHRSVDRGNTWEELPFPNNSQRLSRLVVAPSDDQYIYAATETRIWRSDDGGTNWTLITTGLPGHGSQNVWSLTFYNMVVSPLDAKTVWVGYGNFYENKKVFVSRDAGLTWENVSGNLPNLPVNSLVCDPGTADGIYVGMDAGVFYMDNSMAEWVDFSDGLPNVPVTDMEVKRSTKELYAGTYGSSLWKTDTYYQGEAPVASFDYSILDTCLAEVKFINTSTGYLEQIEWDFGDGVTSQELNPAHQFPAGGSYEVSLTVTNSFGFSEVVDEITVPVPEAAFAVVTSNDTAFFINNSQYANTFKWDFGDGDTSHLETPMHKYPGSGTYVVCLVASNGVCNDTICHSVTISVGIDEPIMASSLKVYPNPNTGRFRVEFKSDQPGEVLLELSDMQGKMICRDVVAATTNHFSKELEVAVRSKGIYTLKIQMDRQVIVRKLVIDPSWQEGKE